MVPGLRIPRPQGACIPLAEREGYNSGSPNLRRRCPMRMLTIAIASLFCGPVSAQDDKATWRELPLIRDGKGAPGWAHLGWGRFTVDDGALRTDCDERGMGLLLYEKEKVGNCRIRVVFKSKEPKSNAGVYVRIDDGIRDWIGKESTTIKRN